MANDVLYIDFPSWCAALGVAMPWYPQPGPQSEIIYWGVLAQGGHERVEDLGTGGARGGGKSDVLIGLASFHCALYGEHATVVFLRKDYTDLRKTIIPRCIEIMSPLGVTFAGNPVVAKWPNGATILFEHAKNAAEVQRKFRGPNYTLIIVEELTEHAEYATIRAVKSALRSAHGVPTLFAWSTNPGGPGHNWVKARYIDPAPEGRVPIRNEETGEIRMFIPSRLEDNRILMDSDPRYEQRIIDSAPSAAIAKAWRWGDWNIVAGGYFSDIWNPDRQILKPFKIPDNWVRFRGFDWGAGAPSALYFGAESTGEEVDTSDGKRIFPRGSIILYRELYTVAKEPSGAIIPNLGTRMENTELGQMIAEYSRGERYTESVADPSVFASNGGPSIYQQMCNSGNLGFTKADNERIAGAQIMRKYLRYSYDGSMEYPGLYVMENCRHWIRTVPVLQMSEKNPEDVDTNAEDHAYDASRYLMMAATRPRGGKRVKISGI